MSTLAFIDTNIFIYADDSSAPAKQLRAVQLVNEHLRARSAVISLQVLQEYFAAATRKLGVPSEIAQRKVELMCAMMVVRFSEKDVVAAIELHRLRRISFWDAMIVHAARVAGASILFSEDLQPGSVWGSVTIVNPFDAP